MAYGLIRWVASFLTGAILILIWAIPPRDTRAFAELIYPGIRWRSERSVEDVATSRIAARVRREAETYQRLHWKDSLSALAVAAREAGSEGVVGLPPQAGEGFDLPLRDALQAELDRLGPGAPRIPVGVIFMDSRVGAHPWQLQRNRYLVSYWEELMASNEPGNPYCFVVAPLAWSAADSAYFNLGRSWRRMVTTLPDSTPPNPLGPCAFHARYGAPGREVASWLWRGGYTFTMGGGARWSEGFRPGGPGAPPFRGFFGARDSRNSWWFPSPAAEQCLQGDESSCLEAVMEHGQFPGLFLLYPEGEGGALEGDPLSSRLYRYVSRSVFAGRDLGLFYDLEREFGEDRFLQFWRSDLGVEEAFHAAFGLPMARWVLEWGQDRLGALDKAPPVRGGAILLTLLTVILLAGVAVVAQGRRG